MMPEQNDHGKPPPPRPDDRDQGAGGRRPALRPRRPRRRTTKTAISPVFDLVAPARDNCGSGLFGKGNIAVALLGLRPHQPAVGAIAADQLVVAALFDQTAVVEHAPGCGRRRSRSTAGAPGRAWCARRRGDRSPAGSPPRFRRRPRTTSSRIRIRGARSSARAIASRWRWPPDSMTPRSPIIVCQPGGNAAMNSWALASRAAASSSG